MSAGLGTARREQVKRGLVQGYVWGSAVGFSLTSLFGVAWAANGHWDGIAFAGVSLIGAALGWRMTRYV